MAILIKTKRLTNQGKDKVRGTKKKFLPSSRKDNRLSEPLKVSFSKICKVLPLFSFFSFFSPSRKDNRLFESLKVGFSKICKVFI